MKPYSGKYAASVVVSILSVAAGLVAYGFVGIIAGEIFSANRNCEAILVPAAAAVICKVLHALLLNVSTWISHRAAYLTLRDIRNAVAAKLMRLPMGYFEVHGQRPIEDNACRSCRGMEKTLAHMLPEMTANLLGPLALMVWMFLIDWRLALCALFGSSLAFRLPLE